LTGFQRVDTPLERVTFGRHPTDRFRLVADLRHEGGEPFIADRLQLSLSRT